MCQHSRIYLHPCINAHMLARARTHTLALTHKHLQTYTHASVTANTYPCKQNKNAFTDTTLIHTQVHSYANTWP